MTYYLFYMNEESQGYWLNLATFDVLSPVHKIPIALCQGGGGNYSLETVASHFFIDDTASDLCIVFSLDNKIFISALPIQSRMSEEYYSYLRFVSTCHCASLMFAVRWQA